MKHKFINIDFNDIKDIVDNNKSIKTKFNDHQQQQLNIKEINIDTFKVNNQLQSIKPQFQLDSDQETILSELNGFNK